jgi:hypothetical protein
MANMDVNPIPRPEAPDSTLDPEVARLQAYDDTVEMMRTMADWHGRPVQLPGEPGTRCDVVALSPDWRESSIWRRTAPDGTVSYSYMTLLTDTDGDPTQATWQFDGATRTANRHGEHLSVTKGRSTSDRPLSTAQDFDGVQRMIYADYRSVRHSGDLHLTARGRVATYAFNLLRLARMGVGRQP